jgi:hypothetical protein
LAFTLATRSATSLKPLPRDVTSTFGRLASGVMPSKSFSVS